MDPLFISIVAVSAVMAVVGATILIFIKCVKFRHRPQTTIVTVLNWKNTNPSTN